MNNNNEYIKTNNMDRHINKIDEYADRKSLVEELHVNKNDEYADGKSLEEKLHVNKNGECADRKSLEEILHVNKNGEYADRKSLERKLHENNIIANTCAERDFIKEVIIVEGRDDIDAVQKAVNADVIATHGYGISKSTMQRIENAYKTRGLIIFTDPDHAGNKIRQRLTELFPEAMQAYISKQDALDKSDIGVENAAPDVIAKAIEAAGRTLTERRSEFTEQDMVSYGLAGGAYSRELRDKLGRRLGIGYGNAKSFLKRLNNYGISRKKLEEQLEELSE